MKASDFRREHFTRGRSFSQADFDAYIDASARFTRAIWTGYLPCLLGGLLLGVFFSNAVGGAAGNILAVVLIYRKPGSETLQLVRLGSHAELGW